MPPNEQPRFRVIRPDGTALDATPEEADKLELLGYKRESPEMRASRLNEVGRETFYTSTPEQFKAGGKALLRGASLGATDLLFDEDATRAQQQYNPGLSMGLEIVGGVAPMFLSGGTSAGAQIAARTPAALAARAGTAVAEATGLGRYGKAAVALGVEGGIVGAAAEADRAYLADDELTAEAVFHGLGFGAVFGAGAGVLGAKFLSAGESAAAKLAGKADDAVVDAEFRMVDDTFELLPRGEGPPAGARRLESGPFDGVNYGGAAPDQAQLPGMYPSKRAGVTDNGVMYANENGTVYKNPPPRLQLEERTGVSEGVFDDLIESPRPDVITPGSLDFAERAVAYATAAEAEALDTLERVKKFRAGEMGATDQKLSWFELQSSEADQTVSRARKLASTAERDAYLASWGVTEAKQAAKQAADKLDQYTGPFSRAVKSTEPAYQTFSSEVANVSKQFGDAHQAAESVMASVHSKMMAVKPDAVPGLTGAKLAFIKKRLTTAFDGIKEAGVKGSPAAKQKALQAYTEAMEVSAESLGISTKAATAMLDTVAVVGEAGRVLRTFPASADAFAKLSPAKAEQLFGAIEAAKKADLYPELTQALDTAAASLASSAGLKATGTDGLRQTWEALRAAAALEKKTPIAAISPSAKKELERELAGALKAEKEAELRAYNAKFDADKVRKEFAARVEQAKAVRAKGAAEWEAQAKKAQAEAAKGLKEAEDALKVAQEQAAKDAAAAAAAEKRAAAEADRAAKQAARDGAKAKSKAEARAETKARQEARQAESKAKWEAANARKAADQSKAKAEAAEKAQRVAEEKAARTAEADARRAETQARQDANYAYTQERRADQAQRRADADSYRQERRADQAERQADRDAAKAEREADRAARQAERDAEKQGKAPGFVGAVGAVAGHAAMGGYTGAMAGRAVANSTWEALAALKLRGISRLTEAAASYFPKAGKAITLVGPKIEPLSRKLDGTTETAKKSREALAADRLKELWNAYGAVNDTLYEGVTQLSGDQPALMSKMHALGANAFRELLRGTPRDPGTVSGLKSIWNPSPLQAMRLGRQLEVFHDPIGEFEKMMSTGSFDPIGVKMLKAAAPALYQEGRSLMLARLGEGNLLESMSYPDQIALSTMLELDIHSSMRPEHIASSQALHQARKEPMEMPIKPQGGAGGRPPSGSSDATSAQQITAH